MKPVSLLLAALCLPAFSQEPEAKPKEPAPREFAILLNQAPVSSKFRGSERSGFAAQSLRQQIQTKQRLVSARVKALGGSVTGTADTLVNAVFVQATPEQAAQFASIDGVTAVAMSPRMKRKMDRAIDLQNVRQAWNAVGGQNQAGAGVKIAILDSGIDQKHPALTDAALRAPAGYPVGDAAWTTGKVIAARSYVSMLTSSDARFSSPDDLSPRDHVGHGTALAAIAAGVPVNAPLAPISGVAPKAWLGNYKIFGSPGIHDETTTAVLIQALEDAYTDGMDLAVLATGTIPFTAPYFGPLETQTACTVTTQIRSYIPTNACDINAYAVEHAVSAGMLVVVAAGNEGCSGLVCPTLGTINSPGTAPSALTVGASTNSHLIYTRVKIGGDTWKGYAGNGPRLAAPLTAQAVDVGTIVSDATGCSAIPANSLTGKIAIVTRGTCTYYEKVNAMQTAGAIAVLMVDTASDTILPPSYLLNETGIPLEYVGVTAGNAIRAALKANTAATITIDPTFSASEGTADAIAYFSSRGPVTGTNSLKPELTAVGAGIYTATQTYDPNGEVWDASGYVGVDGTSFAAAMAAGAAALVKQAHPGYSPAQIKSALVNTAAIGVLNDPYTSALARVTAAGAGKLDAAAAVASNITVNPAVAGFGLIGTTLPQPITLTLTNSGTSAANLTLNVVRRDGDSRANLAVSPSTLTLAAGQSQAVTLTLGGSAPAAGAYEGYVSITGAGEIRVPFHYLVSDRTPANSFPVAGDNYFAVVGETGQFIAFRVTDKNGAPISGAPVQWSTVSGTGRVDLRNSDAVTDAYGIAAALVAEGFTANLTDYVGFISRDWGWEFYHFVNFAPGISANGIVNAATQQAGSLAPGSYASIKGTDFSTVPRTFTTNYLPLTMGQVSVTFDAPGISVVAPASYVSPNFINVQIPWELAGQNTVSVKVRYRDIPGPLYTLQLAPASPAFFEYADATSNNAVSVVAQNLDYSLITSQNAAPRGKVITLYANGLGPVNDPPATGQPSSATVLSRTASTPVVTIGGKTAPVLFSGLTPQTIGLYQINVTVPDDTPTGLQPITVSVGSVTSKTSQLAVK